MLISRLISFSFFHQNFVNCIVLFKETTFGFVVHIHFTFVSYFVKFSFVFISYFLHSLSLFCFPFSNVFKLEVWLISF